MWAHYVTFTYQGNSAMKKSFLPNVFNTNPMNSPLTKYEILNLAINERKMVKIDWKQSFTMKSRAEYVFPLHLFVHQGQEYLIWQRPAEGNLDCAPIVAMRTYPMVHGSGLSRSRTMRCG